MPAAMPAEDATVITSTSRWATWESSWASTASISSASRVRRMPVVTHTTERWGDRPVAKALGMARSATPTRGLGMSASAHSRSIMPCSSGASCGLTSRARIARIASLSEEYHCHQATPSPATPMSRDSPGERTASISPTTSPTKRAPSRNITSVMRVVRPVSLMNRERAMVNSQSGEPTPGVSRG